MTYETIVPLLVRDVPEMRPILEVHRQDYDGVLPHVFFGDLTRFVVASWQEKGPSEEVLRILGFLETAMGCLDNRVQELVSVSFLENLIDTDVLESIRCHLGPKLSEELKAYEER